MMTPTRGGFVPWTAVAGVVQGMYASGGPFLVRAVQGQGWDRHAFRATLNAVWLILNTLLVMAYSATGVLTAVSLVWMLALLPLVPLGLWIGEQLHGRLPQREFLAFVQVVLLLAGLSLVLG